jgi:hypothetical protein
MTHLEQLTTLIETMTNDLLKREQEVAALEVLVRRGQEENQRRSKQLLDERRSVLLQVESMRTEKEEAQSVLLEAKKLHVITEEKERELAEKSHALTQREKAVVSIEKRLLILEEKEKALLDKEKNLEPEKQFIAKQKELLEDKQRVQKLTDTQLRQREDRIQRLYAQSQ